MASASKPGVMAACDPLAASALLPPLRSHTLRGGRMSGWAGGRQVLGAEGWGVDAANHDPEPTHLPVSSWKTMMRRPRPL